MTAERKVLPRGIRNKNPGNIRTGTVQWLGQVDRDLQSYCIFDTVEHGIRALAKLLINYQKFHSLKTIKSIISRWAPTNENDTKAYVEAVSKELNIDANIEIHLEDSAVLERLVAAIIRHENGQQPYSAIQIHQGVLQAGGWI